MLVWSGTSGMMWDMSDDQTSEPGAEPAVPDPAALSRDPAAFQQAHAKYGGYLKEGGLPFEPEELEEDGIAGTPAADADGDDAES